jgi:hypothetical protein
MAKPKPLTDQELDETYRRPWPFPEKQRPGHCPHGVVPSHCADCSEPAESIPHVRDEQLVRIGRGDFSTTMSAAQWFALQDRSGGADAKDEGQGAVPLTDEQIDRRILDALAKVQSREAWDAMTFESGPYSISRVRYWATSIARAIIAATTGIPKAEPSVRERIEAIESGFTHYGTDDLVSRAAVLRILDGSAEPS